MTKLQVAFIFASVVSKKTVTVAVLPLAPWTARQQMRLVLFVVSRSPKRPGRAQLVLDHPQFKGLNPDATRKGRK
jgi:hypothetical protein